MNVETGCKVTALVLLSAAVAGCGEPDETGQIGDCGRPSGADVPFTVAALPQYHRFDDRPPLMTVVTTQQEWDAAFQNAEFPMTMEIPPEQDLATHRIVVLQRYCWFMDARYVVERADEVVLTDLEVGTDGCAIFPTSVGLPRSSKPVRLARCEQPCTFETCG